MNPLGLDIIRTNLILKTSVEENGVVRVVVDLPSNHQFAPAIKEDIVEKLGSLWDVEKVDVSIHSIKVGQEKVSPGLIKIQTKLIESKKSKRKK